MATTIQISNEVKTFLDRIKMFERESYNETIMNLIEDNMPINEKTAKELDSRKFSKEKAVSHEEIKKRLGL